MPRFQVCKDCFDSLSDRRSDERCEGAGKTACELLYSQSRVGVVRSQLFRAAGNTETGNTERADLLALVCGVFCEFVTFPLVSWVRCGT